MNSKMSLNLHPDLVIKWQFGDWDGILQTVIPVETPDDKVCKAIAHFQAGDITVAQQILNELIEQGYNNELLLRAVLSGAFNTLGKSFLLADSFERSYGHFADSLRFSALETDVRSIYPIRFMKQAMQVGVSASAESAAETAFSLQTIPAEDVTSRSSANTNRQKLLSCLGILIDSVLRQGEALTLMGNDVFTGQDPFVKGKLIWALSYLAGIENKYTGTDVRARQFKKLLAIISKEQEQSWGNHFYLMGLKNLYQHGLLEKCFSYDELNELRNVLHWNELADEKTFLMKNKPNNMYQVAFSIALSRFQLGWEDTVAKDNFLERMLDNYIEYSGDTGFFDEKEGKGRYDRYSVLLIAEIAHRYREAGLPLTKQLKKWLRQAADFILLHANMNGVGFQYGRSIGAYGDTVVNEVLSAAVWYDLLTPLEAKMAFTYSSLSTARFLDFWWDKLSGCVNLWFGGRRTESYRNEQRIAGESVSLLYQHIYTSEIWDELGYSCENIDLKEYEQWLTTLPVATLFTFSKQKHTYSALIYRAKKHCFVIPLVNGDYYYDVSSYLPIPYNNSCIQGVPDKSYSFLIPTLIMKDGAKLKPLCWFKEVELSVKDNVHFLTFVQSELCRSEGTKYVSDGRIHIETTYTLGQYSITRQDKIFVLADTLFNITMQFMSFYAEKNATEDTLFFEQGPIEKIIFSGFDVLEIDSAALNDETSGSDRKIERFYKMSKNLEGLSFSPETPIYVEWTIFFKGE
jgi:hypothetical protein